ncbi:MAG TPA: hypothetical protein VGQ14_02450 [Candidatus Eisenbacteria bacterium]|jgi:hypothetical protein|nr:hypothetical protein [Candidatus Eisenbacteria bacterium]
MNVRRVIGVVLTLALLLGQTLVPIVRAACAMPRGAAPPACSFCAGGRVPEGTASLGADRSCCAAKATADREPATVTSSRANESRPETVSFIVAACAPVATPLVVGNHRREAPPPLFDSPHRKTTVLLI